MKRPPHKRWPFHVGLNMRTFIFFKKQTPFIRLAAALIAGILFQYLYPHQVIIDISVLFILILLLLTLSRQTVQQKFKYRFLSGKGLYVLTACLGSIVMRYQNITHHPGWVGHYNTDSSLLLLLTIREVPVERKKTYKALATVDAVTKNGKWLPARGKVWVYFRKTGYFLQTSGLHSISGKQVLVRKVLQPIVPIRNPGGFDYAAYCARQNIYHSIYLAPHDYRIIDTHHHNNTLARVQQYILTVFRSYIPTKPSAAIAEALVIGYKYDLDEDLLDAYRNTGVIHVIAISGMHLGLIYGMLIWLTSFFQKRKVLRWLRLSCILFAIWGFTLLAGAGPSILRAAVIASCLLVGNCVNRKTNNYNTLAASAFILLCYDPFYLWDLGFQLSFAAVLSIMLFAQPLYKSWYCSFRPLRWIWQLCSVTLSAQILTTPIILYHFHQFPNLFLISNLVIVPLSSFILYACLLLLAVSPLPILASITGKAVDWLLYGMNEWILLLDKSNIAVTPHIQLTFVQMITCYAIIICITAWYSLKRTGWLIGSLAATVIFLTIYVNRQFHIRKDRHLIIYQVPGHALTEVSSGGKYLSLVPDSLPASTEKMVSNSRTLFGAFWRDSIRNTTNHPFLLLENIKVVFIHQQPSAPVSNQRLTANLIVIQGNPTLSLHSLSQYFDCRLYVFDSNNSLWKIRKWKKEADSLHLRHHSIPDQGAFVMAF